ncbi:hypothetical protein CHS0354_009225, partial [Potamilus streckersoni]
RQIKKIDNHIFEDSKDHFNTMLSTLWFITVFPSFVFACIMSINFDIFTYYYSDTVDVRLLVVAVVTGLISMSSAILAVWGIWKSARDVVILSKFCECDLDNGIVPVPQPHVAPVICTVHNGMRVGQAHSDERLLIL